MVKSEIYIGDFKKEINFEPIFKKTLLTSEIIKTDLFDKFDSKKTKRVNRSICTIEFIIENIGDESIKDWKLELVFPPEISEIKNKTRYSDGYFLNINTSQVIYSSDNNVIEIDDNIFFTLSFRVIPENIRLKFEWKFNSPTFSNNGFFPISVIPQFIEDKKNVNHKTDGELTEDYYEVIKFSQQEKDGCLFNINEE